MINNAMINYIKPTKQAYAACVTKQQHFNTPCYFAGGRGLGSGAQGTVAVAVAVAFRCRSATHAGVICVASYTHNYLNG